MSIVTASAYAFDASMEYAWLFIYHFSTLILGLGHNQIITGEKIGVSLIPVQGYTLEDFDKNDSLDGGSVVVDDDTGKMRLEKW